ncbi:MAG: sulfotransferase domain-containing protein [Candidatus Sericytochromatia bacterium]
MQHFQIVSAPMPSGVTWLINCLLELGIRTTNSGMGWAETPGGSRMEPEDLRDNLRWFLPVLENQDLFRFREEIEVFWDHRLQVALYPARKTVLMVRDPRDAAYSQFRRLSHQGLYRESEADLLTFLAQPMSWQKYFPQLFDLPPADTLAYYNLYVRHQVPPEHLLTLRFEDCKRDPLGQLTRVLDFFACPCGRAEMLTAIAKSDFRQAQAALERRKARTGLSHLAHRTGRVEEWRSRLSPAALACFRGPAQAALQAFGYEPLPEQEQPPADEELIARASPLLAEFHGLLAAGDSSSAELLLRQLLARNLDGEIRHLLSGQWLALLWTRSVMRAAQSHLPAATRMVRFFSAMNARYATLPQLRQAAARILAPEHPLHFLWPGQLIYRHAPEMDGFAVAAAAALASGQKYFLWQRQGVLLQNTGLFQLCALLESPFPEVVAAVPVCEAAGQDPATFAERAYRRHAQWGAEFQPIRLQQLPDCILLRVSRLSRDLAVDPGAWLEPQPCYQALGVLMAPEA